MASEATASKAIAVILAGGLGNRMGDRLDMPKQFYPLNGKPILVHTLERFARHAEIDSICVVCLAGWEDRLRGCLREYGVAKVGWVVESGDIRQRSVYNGLLAIEGYADAGDVVVVHDGVRLFIEPGLISSGIRMAARHGDAMTSVRSSDSLVLSPDDETAGQALDRDHVYLVQTPQSYRYGLGLELYRRAYAEGITDSINCCELFVRLGRRVHLIPGLKTNIKITTGEDIEFLHALHAIYSGEE